MYSPVLREVLLKPIAKLLGVSLSLAVAFMLSPGVTAKKFVAGVFAAVLIMRFIVEDSTPPPGLPPGPSSPGSLTVRSGVRSGVFEGGLVPMTESSKLKYEITVASALGTIKPVRIKAAAVATRSERNERPLICGDKTALFVFIAW
jgi:hypothetical protein